MHFHVITRLKSVLRGENVIDVCVESELSLGVVDSCQSSSVWIVH